MQKCISLLASLLFLTSITAFAQSKNGTVKGFVYDKGTGEPLIYTNVLFPGTRYGAQTDLNGYFSISLPAGSYTMITTQVGYDTSTSTINLLPDALITKKLFISNQGLQLKGVEISGRKTEKQTHINVGVTTITPKDIKLLPSSGGEPDVAQFLQVVPGVVFTGDQGGQLYIRGGSPAQTGILLDGVTIFNPFHSIGLFSVFETDAIRNVDVYTAGFNAEYGDRTSAIVDVHTKDGNKNDIAGLVSVSPIMTRALLEGPLVKSKKKNGPGVTFLVSAKKSYLDQTSKSIYGGLGEPFSNGLPYSFTDVYGKVTLSSDNGSKLNLFGFSFTDDAKLLDPQTHVPIADFNWKASGGGGTFVVSPGSSSALIDGKFAYSRYNINFNNYALATPSTSEIDNFEAGLNFTYYLPHYSELKYGLEVSGYHTSLSYNELQNISTTLEQQSTLAGLYMVFRKNFGEKFIIEPSIRFQYYSELSQVSPEPRLGIKYNINDNLRLKFATGLYSQNIVSTKNDVDIVNFFTGFSLSPQQTVNGTNGQPVSSPLQTAYHVSGGIEYDLNRVELNLEPWVKDFTRLIEINRYKLYSTDPDFAAGTGIATGLDLSAKYSYDRIYLWGAAGLQNVNYTNIGSDGKVQTYPAPFDRRFNLNIVGAYTAGKKKDWDLSARFNLGSPFPFTLTQGFYEALTPGAGNNVGSNVNQQNGTLTALYANAINGGRLSWYHRLDVSAKKRFALSKKSSIDLTFSLTNVYDRQNIFYVDRYSNISIFQLPIFPSVNLTWNF